MVCCGAAGGDEGLERNRSVSNLARRSSGTQDVSGREVWRHRPFG